jgi:disulfide bond formation protein DsbB
MCHWQRWPLIAAAIIGLAGTRMWKGRRQAWIAATLVLVAAAGLAITGQWFNAPYVAAAVIVLIALLALVPAGRLLPVAVVALVAVSGLIGLYQTGMQTGILPGPSACTVAHAYVLGSAAPAPEVSCNAVTWSLFSLSLAAYNALFCLGAAAVAALFLMKKS